MRTLLRILAMVILTFLMLSLTECNPNKSDKEEGVVIEADKDFEREREEIRKDLNELRDDLDKRLGRVNKKLETAGKETRNQLEEAKRKLTDERTEVNKTQ
jgi:hypothetical protein